MAGVSAPYTWWALFTTGLLFPLHILLGLGSVPLLSVGLLRGNRLAWTVFVLYLPFYAWPAQFKVPGWKWDRLWSWFRVRDSAISYNGEFAVHLSEEFDEHDQYFVGVHPHGTLIFQRIFWLTSDLRQFFARDYRMLCASILFRVPLMRELTLFFGGVDAGRPTVEKVIHAGHNVVLYPGGLDEANTVESATQVQIRTRTGFIRLAVQHGLPVLPMFCFGELEAVRAVPMLPRPLAKLLQRKFRVSSTLFVGRWGTFVPCRTPYNLVIGRAIATKRCEGGHALDEEVTRVHAAYKVELKRIYEENKTRFGYADRELVFTCELKAAREKVKAG